MIIYKLDEHGRETLSYPAERILEQTDSYICVEAFFGRDDHDAGYAVFKRNDRFVEYFYNNRWYNIFVIYDRDDQQLKGWYCNVCRPATWNAEEIRCEDLALDIWITPDGETLVLDEDEFAELEISDEEREWGNAAVSQILMLVQNGRLPS